ncbi:MAG TPA: condensation domain-containing protein, partial [Thermoanaerobaculia bacterium]
APAAIALPYDRPRRAVQTFRGAALAFTLPPDLTARLTGCAKAAGATPFMALLAGFAALLGRLAGQDDLVVGTPIANRNQLATERLIGLFVNTLALRHDLRGDPTVGELLARSRDGALAAYAHQDLPFERLVAELQPERNLSHNPLFQVMFALQNAPLVPLAEIDLPGLALAPFAFDDPTAKLDLQLDLTEAAGDGGRVLRGELRYATDLFDRTTMQRLVGQLTVLLDAFADGQDLRLTQLPLLADAERHQVAVEWSAGGTHVVDAGGRPVPIGVVGQVEDGGGTRAGEVGRYGVDGRIEVLGRDDEVVLVRGHRVLLREIEGALLRQRGVRDAVVTVHGAATEADRRLAAYVVLAEGAPASADSGSVEHVAGWRALFDDAYGRASEGDADGETFVGWTSSFTGLPLPATEMREWLDNTVEALLALPGRRVLEVGCGGGLLLARLLPHVDLYRGIDISAAALELAGRRLERERARGAALPPVVLRQDLADDWSHIAPGEVDLVVIHSVAQCFPSLDYLTRVLEGALAAVEPGGTVFVGDLRSLALHAAFHAAVAVAAAADELPLAALRSRIANRMDEEEELIVDPAFFVELAERLPVVRRVELLPKRGRARNELTRFRYDAMLHVGEGTAQAVTERWVDWHGEALSLGELQRRLENDPPARLALSGITDARLVDVVALAGALASDSAADVAALRRMAGEPAARAATEAIEPEALLALARELG